MNGLKTNLRILWRRRESSLAIIATLGVAIGTVTAALTAVRALTRPLAYPHSDRLMHVQAVWERGAGTVAFIDYEALRDRSQAFTDVAAYATWRGLTLGDRTSTESADADFLTPSYLTLIGAKPLHGRLLIADDGVGEGRAVVVLGNGLWRRRFQANPEVVGTTIRVNGFSHEVVGVLAAPERGAKDLGFADGLDPQLFLPAQRLVTVAGHPPLSSGARIFWVLGLRSPDASAAQAVAEIGAISASLQRERPDTHRGIHLRAESLNRRLQGGLQRPALALLAGAFLIFLVAVANVSNLLLIQFSESRGALTLRLAVGASLAQVRLMLWQQWMVLIGFGAASGTASTVVTTRALRIWIESEVAPFATVSMDGSILLAVLALLILLLGGVSLAPSLSLRSLELRSALAIGARSIAQIIHRESSFGQENAAVPSRPCRFGLASAAPPQPSTTEARLNNIDRWPRRAPDLKQENHEHCDHAGLGGDDGGGKQRRHW